MEKEDKNMRVAFSVKNRKKEFVNNVDSIQEFFWKGFVVFEDECGELLPDDQWCLKDEGGNILLEGRKEVESPIGMICWDGLIKYDKVCDVRQCTDDELKLIEDAYNEGWFVEDCVIQYIKQQ